MGCSHVNTYPPVYGSCLIYLGLTDNLSRPALSASLEYFKYCAGKHLPSMFMEAQLDYFGAHSYDLKSEGAGEVKKGKSLGSSMRTVNMLLTNGTGTHHYEWKSA